MNDLRWKKMQRNWMEVYRSEIGAKTEWKQSKNKGLRDFATSAKLALRCEAISQPKRSRYGINVSLRKRSSFAKPISQLNWLLCENFRSCETKFGTRVPFRSIGAPISQLRNDYEAPKHKNSQFRSQSSIPQGILQLRSRFWHTSAISQHSDSHFAAAKRLQSSKAWKFPISQPKLHSAGSFAATKPFLAHECHLEAPYTHFTAAKWLRNLHALKSFSAHTMS